MINKSTKLEIVEAAKLYMEKNELGQDSFAKHVVKMNGGQGFSVAYLNDMLKGKFVTGNKQTPIDDKYFVRMAKAIGFTVKKTFRKHHDNDNFLLCMNAFSDARDSRMPYAIDGPTGEGKSYAAMEYLANNPKHTYYVRCDGDLTAKSFFMELSQALGMNLDGAVYNLRKNIIQKLKNETDALLIVDEAENLKDRAWDSLKRIIDDLKGYTGIAFIGANEFEKALEKKANKNKGCFPQILRRLREGGFVHLFSLSLDDAIDVCKPYGITSKTHVKALYDKCRNMAQLVSLIEKCMREADHGKRDVLELIELYCNVNLKIKAA